VRPTDRGEAPENRVAIAETILVVARVASRDHVLEAGARIDIDPVLPGDEQTVGECAIDFASMQPASSLILSVEKLKDGFGNVKGAKIGSRLRSACRGELLRMR
jgi:hypothetical protein